MNFNQELEELLGDCASPIGQAKPALKLNSVRAGCLVTPLVQDGQQITKLNLSVAVDVGAACHLGGGDDGPTACQPCRQPIAFGIFSPLCFSSSHLKGPVRPCSKDDYWTSVRITEREGRCVIPNNHRLARPSDTGGSNGNRLGLRDWCRLRGRLEGNGKQASTDDARGNDVVVHVISPGLCLENIGSRYGKKEDSTNAVQRWLKVWLVL